MGKPDFEGLRTLVALVSRLLNGEALTIAAIKQACNVQHAAARGRLHLLAELPDAVTEKRRGHIRSVKLPVLIQARPTVPTDVVAACLTSSLGSALPETQLREHLNRLRDGVVARSPKHRNAADLDRKFWFVVRGGERALPARVDDFGDVAEAILESKRITFDYRGFEQNDVKKSVRVTPLTLALHEHQFYVVAPRGDSFHPYRFARMTNIRVGRRFTYPTRQFYEPSKIFSEAFGVYLARSEAVEVRFRLMPKWTNFVESHRWHPSQKETTLPDGRIEVRMTLRVDEELTRKLLWFGAEAEVIAPASLRVEVAERLRAAAAVYRTARPLDARVAPSSRAATGD